MKHYIIWPILVPAIAFCQDEQELTMSGTVTQETHSSGGSWDTTDFDSFLQQPPAPPSVHIEGTVTDEGNSDLYDDRYDDMNNR